MGWARLDDGFHDHPKLIGLSLEALGLWTKCLTWAHRHHGSSAQLGFVPVGLATMFAGSRGEKLGNELVTARLWDETDGGWLIHDYIDYLPASERPVTADDVRKSRSEAGKRGAEARWSKANGKQDDGKLLSDSYSKPMPPTRPEPLATTDVVAKEQKRATRIPPDWQPSPDLLSWAALTIPAVDVLRETPNFVDWWTAQPGAKGVKADWDATWRTWMRRQTPASSRRPSVTESNMAVVAEYASLDRLGVTQ